MGLKQTALIQVSLVQEHKGEDDERGCKELFTGWIFPKPR